MEELVSILRSCLLTSKIGTTLPLLSRDYREIEGRNIPYRELGFNSLEDLLKSRPDAFRPYMKDGQKMVEGVETAETAHIKDLVTKQRWARKKGKSLGNYSTQQRRPNAGRSTVMNRYPPYNRNTPSSQQFAARPAPPAVRRTPMPPPRVDPPPQPVWKPVSQPVPPPPRVQPPVLKPNPVPEQPRPARLASPPAQPLAPAPAPVVPRATSSRPLSERLVIKPAHLTPHQPLVSNPPETPQTTSQRIFVPTVVTSRDDDRTRLCELAKRLSIGEPRYTIKKYEIHGKQKVFCSVSIESGDRRTSGISSYPNEAQTVEDAEKLAATAALEVLHGLYHRPVPNTVTEDKNVIKQRILAIVDEHDGVFESQVPIYYMNKYNEGLPDCWPTIVSYFPQDLCFETNLVDHPRILFRYDDAIAKANLQSKEKLTKLVPSEFIFPSGEFVAVFISHVSSTTEIWGNIIGVEYSDKLVALSQKMSNMYSRTMEPVKHVISGEYYVAYDEEGWERVRVDSADQAKKVAQVYFIDRGHQESIGYDFLYPFDKELCSVAAQAVQLAMAGLECLDGCKTVTNIVSEQLLHKRCYICLTSGDVSLRSVAFYDTSTDEDILVNEEVQKKIIERFASDKFKTLTNVKVFEVKISHVDITGEIYLQINNDGFQIVSALIDQFLNIKDILTIASVQYIDRNDMYLVQREDGKWMRGKIIKRLDNDQKLEMHLIDIGGSVIVDFTKILHVTPHAPMLAKFPVQAFLVRLHNISSSSFDKLTVDQLVRLAPPGFKIVCKVISDFPKPPTVELFKRSQPEDALISINNTLALLPELEKSNGDGNNNVKPMKKRLERVNSLPRYLPKPSLSYKELREVRVTDLVVSPSHFFVNPRQQLADFKQLMLDMQKHYKSYTGIRLTIDMLRKGTLCAAKYMDRWYRAYIQSVNNDEIDVYLCDYGRPIPSLSIDNLLPLEATYCALPQQAIKAQLHGIKPRNGDWSPSMCMQFHKLVANKDFFTKVYDVQEDLNEDEYLPTKFIVNLELIDTSTTVDIHIRQQLVEEQMATLTSTN